MRVPLFATVAIAAALGSTALAAPTGTAFTYRGQLLSAGKPVDGSVDITFALYDSLTDGGEFGTNTLTGMPVTNGRFTAALDFGKVPFNGEARWIEIIVNGQVLAPRQPITPTPYALYAAVSPGSDFWTNGTNSGDIAYGKSGRVGIGTSTPNEKLHVNGAVQADANGLTATDPNNAAALVKLSWLNDVPRIRWGGTGTGSANGLDFQKSGDVSLMHIMNDGKVGIGTSAPETKLHVQGGTDSALGGGGFLVLGDTTTINVSFDNNEIMARDNGATSTLFLNADGGNVAIGTKSPLAPLHVRGTSGDNNNGVEDYNYVAMFENPSDTDADGIAIWIHNSHTSALNNFVTFLDSSKNVAGRIEGFDLESGDWEPPAILGNVDVKFGVDFDDGKSPYLKIHWSDFSYDWDNGSLPSFGSPPVTFSGLPTQNDWEELISWCMQNNLQSFMVTDPVDLATESLRIAVMKEIMDEGVVYGSKGADYAEWMPKQNAADRFQMGQIVGVHGGRVSLDTDGADYIMAVSLKPVVLGNQPPAGEADAYVKCAFMGQVKVVVRGVAHAGDFIVASGQNDGTGIAVAPGELTLEQAGRVLGRAWSDSANELISLVNVGVGLPTREWAGLFIEQQNATRTAAQAGEALRDRVNELEAALAAHSAESEALRVRLERLESLVTRNGASD